MKIQVRINEEGALRNQRHAFSNRFTLVSELLQNARRAGARLIRIDHDPQARILTVQDDGHGLDDFQKLLSFHESGWDADTCTQERPFGVGFSKCLYAASRCVVASGRRRVDIDTAAALAKALVEVEECVEGDAVAGTRVELHGVDLPDLAQRVVGLCSGCAVPVGCHGVALERARAV
ncbi:MAG: ATP-binding protein, partial [Pseudomonadota bacterium]